MTAARRPAHSERDRVARLGDGCRLLVFGFWTGELPPLTRLHFLTVAKALPADSRYVLFTHRATIPEPMRALLDATGIEVVPIDAPLLLREVGAAALLRTTPLSRHWETVRRIAERPGYARLFTWCGHDHAHRFTPRSNFLLGGPPVGVTTLSNYLRVVISTIVPTHTLYCDLDFAFPRALDWIFRHGSFVYRWQRRAYANNALISATADSPVKRGALLDLLVRKGAGRSWVLFSEENCRACGLDILPCDRLDPLWSQGGPRGPKYRTFLKSGGDAAADLAFLQDRFDAIHWHNQWMTSPDSGSPYDLWLRELESDAGSLPARAAR